MKHWWLITGAILVVAISAVLYQTFYFMSVIEGTDTSNISVVTRVQDKIEKTKESGNEILIPIYFVGDILLGRHVEYLMSVNGIDYPFAYTNFPPDGGAYVVGNFEASIPTNHIKTPNFGFNFSVSEKYLLGLKKAGFTHLSLANNHALDNGVSGFASTKEVLTNNGFAIFGQPKSVNDDSISYIDLTSKYRIALIAIHTLYGSPDKELLMSVIEKARASSSLQIALVHWGEEYQTDKPSLKQLEFAQLLSDLGVKVIVGHHPHVIQPVSVIGDSLVFYSLGNYIFDQYFSTEVQEGLVLKLVVDSEKLNFDLIPVTSVGTHAQPHEMNTVQANKLLENLAQVSDLKLAEEIKQGRIEWTNLLATSTEMAIIDR